MDVWNRRWTFAIGNGGCKKKMKDVAAKIPVWHHAPLFYAWTLWPCLAAWVLESGHWAGFIYFRIAHAHNLSCWLCSNGKNVHCWACQLRIRERERERERRKKKINTDHIIISKRLCSGFFSPAELGLYKKFWHTSLCYAISFDVYWPQKQVWENINHGVFFLQNVPRFPSVCTLEGSL